MATKTYGDLCPGSKHMGIVLRNFSMREVCIPPKTVIGNVQTAEKSLIGKCSAIMVRTLLQGSRGNYQRSTRLAVQIPWKKRWPSQPPKSSCSELEVPTLEHDVLGKVYMLGCTEWDLKDQQEAQSVLREYADVFAKDDLDLRWTSIVKHKIMWRRGLGLFRNAIEEYYQGCIMRSRSTSRKWLMLEQYDHPIVPGPVQWCWLRKKWQALFLHQPEEVELLDG